MPTQSNATNLTSGVARSANSFSPAAIVPDGHQIMLFTVSSRVSSGTPNVPSVSLGSWTFTQVATNTYNSGSARITMFVGVGPTTGAAVPNISFGGQTQQVCGWVIDQVTNTLVSGTGGINATRNVAVLGTSGTGFSITMAGFANANNATYAVSSKDAVNPIAPGSPMSMVVDQESSGSPNLGIGSQFAPVNVANPNATYGGSGGDRLGAIAIELVFASGIGGWII